MISLRQLVQSEPTATVISLPQQRTPITVSPVRDREHLSHIISKYNLLAVPVVDADERVLGIVTVDDVIDAIIEEAAEDLQKFGGTEAFDEPYLKISFASIIRKRAGWLCALFLSEMLTASAMQHYSAEIEKAVVLSLFIPLIMSSGGILVLRQRRSYFAPLRSAKSRSRIGGASHHASYLPGLYWAPSSGLLASSATCCGEAT